MTDTICIERPAAGATYSHFDKYGVYAYGVYERGSVLEGQEKRSLLGLYDTIEDAREDFPGADETGCGYSEHVISDIAPSWFDPTAAGERWSEDD